MNLQEKNHQKFLQINNMTTSEQLKTINLIISLLEKWPAQKLVDFNKLNKQFKNYSQINLGAFIQWVTMFATGYDMLPILRSEFRDMDYDEPNLAQDTFDDYMEVYHDIYQKPQYIYYQAPYTGEPETSKSLVFNFVNAVQNQLNTQLEYEKYEAKINL